MSLAGVDERAEDPFEEFNRAMGADGDASPYPGFAAARAAAPVHADVAGFFDWDDATEELMALGAGGVYTAYSFDAVHQVLGDGETFSSSGYAEVMGVVLGHSILEMDEPEHHAYRSLIQQAFTRRAMERWEHELVGPVVNRMIDGFAGEGRTDLVRNLHFPFPLEVIAALMDLPPEDYARFHRLAVELVGVSVNWDRAVAASATLQEYFCGLIGQRRDSDSPDLISVLARAEQHGQRLTDDEIVAFLRLLLPAGAETTYRSSANLMFGLLSDPDQLGALRDDRSLMPQAIEEGIRWEPPLLIIARLATRNAEVCGVAIPKGATVIVNMGSANHDDTRWLDPDRFDIFREPKAHLGFARGPHSCLGMHLARMETAVVVNAILDRLPDVRFDPQAGPQYISGMTFRAPPRLDVVWG